MMKIRWGKVQGHLLKKVWGSEEWSVSAVSPYKSSFVDYSEKELLTPKETTFLAKIIKTTAELSLQLHPKMRGKGKDECWYILEAQRDSKIYLDFLPGADISSFYQEIEENTLVLEDYLITYTPQAGDFFYIPAGTIHAIGRNLKLLEIQRPLDITYRLYDWGRRERELHLELAKSEIESKEKPNEIILSKENILLEHPDFLIEEDDFENKKVMKKNYPAHRGKMIFIVKGEVEICVEGEKKMAKEGDVFFFSPLLDFHGDIELISHKKSKIISVY